MSELRKAYGDYIIILLILLVGTAATLRFAWMYQNSVEIVAVSHFKGAARERIQLIKDALETNEAVMNSVAAFYRASKEVSPAEFDIFVDQALKDHPYIQALDWVPDVKGEDRAFYERQVQEYYPGFSFRDKVEDGFVVAAERPQYSPIYYTNHTNHRLLGFDLAHDPIRGPFLRRALENREITASEGVQLLVDPTHKKRGVLFAMPVFRSVPTVHGKDFMESFIGYIVSVVPLADMIDTTLKLLKHEGVNIFIHDLSETESSKLLYVRSTRVKQFTDEEMMADYQSGVEGERAVIEVGTRKWEIAVLPAQGFFNPGIQRETWLIMGGGVMMTLLLAFYMQRRAKENERIAQQVDERTRELNLSKRQTEMILVSTSDAIAGLDAQGNIVFTNPRATALLGYSRREMIGRGHHELLHYAHEDGKPYNIDECPVMDALEDRQSVTVSNEVFWKKDGTALQVEYTASPIIDGDIVTGTVVVFRDITERRHIEAQLQQMARYDQLTGLANRAMLLDLMRGAIARAARTGRVIGLIYMDLDNFKPINDTLGHEAGDAYLKAFANLLKSSVREYDTAARLGGDEFVILADNLNDKSEGLVLVDRILERLQETINIDGHQFRMAASFGISYYPDDSNDAETLLRHADAAMYQAKKDKEKKYVVYES